MNKPSSPDAPQPATPDPATREGTPAGESSPSLPAGVAGTTPRPDAPRKAAEPWPDGPNVESSPWELDAARGKLPGDGKR